MSLFNTENQGHINGYAKLFLGEPLGLSDNVNVQYPELERLYQQQASQIWNEFEVDITQDRMDIHTEPVEVVDLMTKTISWQYLMDTVAARSVSQLLLPHCTNPEMEHLINIWAFFETIHARTYAHIVKQTFDNPVEVLTATYANHELIARSRAVIEEFESFQEKGKDVTEEDIIVVLAALFGLEEIGFLPSFAVTFGVATYRRKFMGVAGLVKLICRDEVLHTQFGAAIQQINHATMADAMKAALPRIKAVLDAIVAQELHFSEYLFSEGREVLGLNAELLKQYVRYMAAPVYTVFGLTADFEVPATNPLPYMEDWIDGKRIQTAPQDLQNSAYQVGAIVDDTAGLEFDL